MEKLIDRKLYVNEISITHGIPAGSYLARLPVIKQLYQSGLHLTKPVTFFVGENGIGKSTLIEGIAVAMGFNPEGGTINFNFSTEDSYSELHQCLRIKKGLRKHRDGFFLRAESFYNVASYIDQQDRDPDNAGGGRIIESYGGVSLHRQSHGESFLTLVQERFGGNGLYILDEPEAALSPMRLMTLMCHIQELVERHSQFIISTHSPILMTFPGAEIFLLSEDNIRSVCYEETEHFQVTKKFMNAPDIMLRHLLGDAADSEQDDESN